MSDTGNINSIVSENLKRIREEKRMSQDAVALASGISKSMLSQIERGDVNPTISTVWKIVHGLKISFTDLVGLPESDYETIDISSIDPVLEDNGKCRDYPLFPFDSERRFEICYLEIDSGGVIVSEPHPSGTQEYLIVLSGALSVSINSKKRLTVANGGAMRFRGDKPHRYENSGSEKCRLCTVIYYSP